MKGHKMHHAGRKHRNTGGANEAEMDLRDNPEERNNAKEIFHDAEERKHGGHVKRTKRKHGGHVMKHEGMGPEHEATGGRAKRKRGGHVVHHHTGHVKHVGSVHGEHGAHHAGRKPRKSGGRATSDNNPFTSAAKGTAAKGRKPELKMDGGPGEE